MLTAESKEEVEQELLNGKQAMTKRGTKVNISEVKVMVTGKMKAEIRSGR